MGKVGVLLLSGKVQKTGLTGSLLFFNIAALLKRYSPSPHLKPNSELRFKIRYLYIYHTLLFVYRQSEGHSRESLWCWKDAKVGHFLLQRQAQDARGSAENKAPQSGVKAGLSFATGTNQGMPPCTNPCNLGREQVTPMNQPPQTPKTHCFLPTAQ